MLLVGCELVFPLWRGLCLIHPVGNSLVVQGLGPCGFTAEGLGSIPGRGAEILQAVWCGQKKKNTNIWSLLWECAVWPRAGPEEDVRRRRLTATLPVLGDCSQQGLFPDQGLPETDHCLNKRRRVLRTDAKALSCVSWEKWVSFRTVHMICHFV